ncbi:solute carrier family 22 member 10-like isoform X2 [Drosophila kikkawai]|uniref:Solute carrier family 22 member 10-like isoform X2 n=1 Tax=Drosophila kikkawai TaxID=30033 RepID=A0A6P4I3Y0_DROKI|nr:solute carrier family 22 member 4-like isoform X2 [Drosophila kikkawai]
MSRFFVCIRALSINAGVLVLYGHACPYGCPLGWYLGHSNDLFGRANEGVTAPQGSKLFQLCLWSQHDTTLASVILPLDMGSFQNWRALQLLNLLPGFCGFIIMLFLPESPKYYLSMGQDAKAMKVMERICRCNKGKDATLATLGIESVTQTRLQTTDTGHCAQIKSLLTNYRKYMTIMILIVLVLCGFGFALPVWMVRIRVSMQSTEEETTVCEHMQGTIAAKTAQCDLKFSDLLDAIIHGFVVLSVFIITSLLLFVLSRRVVMLTYIAIAIVGSLSLNFARNSYLILVCFFALIDAPLCCIRLLFTFIIDLIPTYLRGKATAILFMMGRVGILLTSLLVGYTLGLNCLVTFNTLLICLVVSSILVFMLPSDRRVRETYNS